MNTIDDIINNLQDSTGIDSIFWDDSRMWTLGYREDGGVYGVQRPYLGGGVRGSIRSNIQDEKIRDLFGQALRDIEAVYNQDTQGLESWYQNTGVLL